MSSIDEKYPSSLPSTSKYRFKKVSSKVFSRNPWKANEHTDSETLPDLTLPVSTVATRNVQQNASSTEGTYMPLKVQSNLTEPSRTQNVQHDATSTERLKLPLHVDLSESEIVRNPTPKNIQQEEECASTDIRTEIMAGGKSRNQKLFDCKVKLKKVITKIDKLTTPMSTYTLLEDDKSCDENLIFSNELKDTGEYLIKMGKTFLERATALEIVTSPQSQLESNQIISDDNDDDVIYISTDNVKVEAKSKIKKNRQQHHLRHHLTMMFRIPKLSLLLNIND